MPNPHATRRPGRPHTQWRSTLVGLATAAVILSSCTAGPESPEKDEPAAGPQTVDLGGGGRLLIPQGAFGGDVVKVDVSHDGAPRTPGDRDGLSDPVDITVRGGAQPEVPVKLEFPYDPSAVPAGEDPNTFFGVSSYDEQQQTWVPLRVKFHPDSKVMTALSPTLSWKWPWEWDWPGIGAALNQDIGELLNKRAPQAAQCTRGQPIPRWVASTTAQNQDAIALRGCAEGEDGAAVIELVNNRPYGVTIDIDARTRWTWREEPDSLEALLSLHLLESTVVDDDQLYLAPLSRGTVAFGKGPWTTANITSHTSPATLLADYIGIAVGPALSVGIAKKVAGILAGSCLGPFVKTSARATVESVTQFHELMGAGLDCMEQVMLGSVLDRALPADARARAVGRYQFLGRLGWWAALWSAAWNGSDQFVDHWVNAGRSTVSVFARPPLLLADNDGLGNWPFGDPAQGVVDNMVDWFGDPEADTGWQQFARIPQDDQWHESPDPTSNAWSYPTFRATCWDAFCAIFGGASAERAAFRGWELSSWRRWGPAGWQEVDITEPRIALAGTRIALGDTWADFTDAYPDAVAGYGEGGSLVIDSPPWPGIFDGVWSWRLDGVRDAWDNSTPHVPPGAGVTRMSGGEGPEPGCC